MASQMPYSPQDDALPDPWNSSHYQQHASSSSAQSRSFDPYAGYTSQPVRPLRLSSKLPQSLMPGSHRRPQVQTSTGGQFDDLFFTKLPSPSATSPTDMPLYPERPPWNWTSPPPNPTTSTYPPLPPPPQTPALYQDQRSVTPPSESSNATPTPGNDEDEDEEMKRVLALSLMPQNPAKTLEQLEEEELARALQESLSLAGHGSPAQYGGAGKLPAPTPWQNSAALAQEEADRLLALRLQSELDEEEELPPGPDAKLPLKGQAPTPYANFPTFNSVAQSQRSPTENSLTLLRSASEVIEPELLRGVSLGFHPPVISANPESFQGPIPNVVFLPHGSSPPLHIQAPSWRQLVKLLGRMCDSKLEPTPEARKTSNTDFKLRTVIQFVRLHSSSTQWRVVLYLSLDIPVPPLPGTAKYTQNDVNVLPWSYTLSPLPALLRQGADSAIAKYYTVPAIGSLQYPTLPLDVPNLALYLIAAVNESRRFASDGSSGVRKLARMIDTFYPQEHQEVISLAQERAERRPGGGSIGGGSIFQRALGRRTKGDQDANAAVYDIITPFRVDDWG